MPHSINPGELFDRRFTLESRLGAGASGEVWRARDRLGDTLVALKILHPEEDALRSRWREIAALRRLQVPGVARLRHIGGGADLPNYLVTELIEGPAFLDRPLPVRWVELGPQFEALLETLAVVHGQGMAHGDLKPENILVGQDGRPILVDFGLSTGEAARDASRRAAQGTPAYLAPEVLRGGKPGPAADLYALGLLAYEALTGQPLHDTSSRAMLLRGRLGPLPADLDTTLASIEGLPARIARLLTTLLAPDPGRRPTTIDALRQLGARDTWTSWGVGEPADEGELRALFKGPEIAFHIPSDAARELWRRSNGRPEEMAAELDAWQRLGLVQRHEDGVVITRAALDRLQRMPLLRPPTSSPTDWTPLGRELAGWGRLVRPALTAELLAELVDASIDDVHEVLARLADAGAARPHRLGWQFHPLGELGLDHDEEVARVAVLLNRLPDDHPARPDLAQQAGDAERHQHETLRQAQRLQERGHVRQAISVLRDAVVERSRRRLPLDELLTCWARTVENVLSAELLEELLWWLEAQPKMSQTFRVLSLAHTALNSDARTALELLEAAEAPADPKLQWALWVQRYRASQYLPVETSEAVLEAIETWVDAYGGEAEEAVLLGWRAMVSYRRQRYLESAELQRQAAARKGSGAGWLSSRINEIWGLVDGLDLLGAQAAAREILPVARAWEHYDYEMRLVWLERFATVRLGREPLAPSDEILEAARSTGLPEVEGRACLLESVVAWRADQPDRALRLALRAREMWIALGAKMTAVVTDSFVYFLDPASCPRDLDTLVEEAAGASNSRLRLSSLGMLQRRPESGDHPAFDAARREYEGLSERERTTRLEFMSLEEAWGPVRPAPDAD